jgi:hypothetical protein
MSSLINNFKARSRSSIILDGDGDGNVKEYIVTFFDGYDVTFRTVVDDEVWSLKIHEPTGNALKMADICRQIMTDMETKTFKESKYVELLDDIHEKE